MNQRATSCAVGLIFALGACTGSTSPAADTPVSPSSAEASVAPEPIAAAQPDEIRGEPVKYKTAVEPKPLTDEVRLGLKWLASHQLKGGGWGQGDEAPTMGRSAISEMAGTANVADTAMAVLALMRSGSTPQGGEFAEPIERGVKFILAEVEESDDDSVFVTDIRGTRVQSKIGTHVDTFAALMVLTEVENKMASKKDNERVGIALDKVLGKVQKNQGKDGSWGSSGWAVALSQGMATRGLNRAAMSGRKVDRKVLDAAERYAAGSYSAESGTFGAADAAGIDLYAGASQTSAMKSSVTTRKAKKKKLKKKLASKSTTKSERVQVQAELDQTKRAEEHVESMQGALTKRLQDPAFIKGFGNNGGEEFLSYLMVSETLVVDGDDKWQEWDRTVTKLVNAVQNDDGSWTGHHCITGRTFCTAVALMVLLADRTPAPVTDTLAG